MKPYTFSDQQYMLLASQQGAQLVTGLEDPFRGWLVEEIEEVWLKTREELSQRGLLMVQGEEMQVEAELERTIGVCAAPDASLAVTCTLRSQEPRTITYHLKLPDTVRQEVEHGNCTLIHFDSQADFTRDLFQMLRLEEQPAAESEPFDLPQSITERFPDLAEEKDRAAIKKALESAGAPIIGAEALAETLQTWEVNSALALYALCAGGWEVSGMGFLAGGNGLWQLRHVTRRGSNHVALTPLSGAKAREKVEQLLKRLLLNSNNKRK